MWWCPCQTCQELSRSLRVPAFPAPCSPRSPRWPLYEVSKHCPSSLACRLLWGLQWCMPPTHISSYGLLHHNHICLSKTWRVALSLMPHRTGHPPQPGVQAHSQSGPTCSSWANTAPCGLTSSHSSSQASPASSPDTAPTAYYKLQSASHVRDPHSLVPVPL